MMDRNYPTSSFVDPLVPPAQTVAWAYDRSPSSIKPSSSYGATHLESELLQRQTYVSTQLPTYTSTHHPTGLSGVFDSSGSTTETSIMNFLSAMESRSLQAGSACSMLPSFRPPSWSAGTNSSTTELYLTGALPSTATFPSPAALSAYQHVGASPSGLSAYQHVGAFPPRCYTSTPSLTLQDPVFSTSSGLLPHHDPLLHLKPSQAALAFNHLPAPSLGSALPIQSSTYRSAQESAPHLLQPQFSLLPQTLASSQPASSQPASAQPTSLPYGSPVFSGSVERALQRECSVIKHHQRPSSGQAAPEQLPGSLQGYLGSGDGDVSYQQDPSRHTPGPSPPVEPDPSQGVNGTPQPKPDSASQTGIQQSQAYSSSDLSPGYSSSSGGAKAKDCSSEMAPHPSDGGEGHPHPHVAGGSPESYPSPGQKQSSVTASQQLAGQLPSLLAISHSQSYPTSHSQTQVSFSSSDKLPSLYKTMPSFSDQAGSGLAVSQSLVYSSSQGQVQDAQYVAQAQALCLGSLSQAYTPSHSQGTPNVSYPSQSQEQDSSTQSYVAGQSLSSSYPQPRAQSLTTTNSMQGYVLMQPSPVGKADSSLSLSQTHPQKYLLPTPSPTFSPATHAQALQNNNRSSGPQDLKPAYGKLKLEELHIQELQALQHASLDASCPGSSNMAGPNNVVYVVSKMDDRYNTQSVIRSSLRSEEQMLGHLTPGHLTQGKDERLLPPHSQLGSRANSCGAPDPKTTNNPQILSSHVSLSAEELKQHSHLLRATEPLQQSQQVLISRAQADHSQARSQAAHTQFTRVPNTQVLLEPSQMVLQQPLIHPGHHPSKGVSAQQNQKHASSPGHVQYLHLNGEMIGHSGLNGSHQGAMDSTKHLLPKDPYGQAVVQQDNKHQFPLNSICFPESILLADERNILSNVDDILAATAAACGVTPHDFVKATSDGDMASMADSKGHFQTAVPRHLNPGFSSSQHAIIANTSSSHAMTLNGSHVTSDGRPGHPSNGSDLHANGGVGVEEDYKLSYDPSGLGPGAMGKTQALGPKAIKREESLVECSSEGFPRKRARPRTSGPGRPAGQEEEEAGGRPAKRGGGQAKRQNSRGSDTSSPSTSDGVYDGYQQHERIRQKIREVEEKQPEVKTGFIGSFLDFLKSGPKQHFSSTPARAASRSRKPSSKPPPCPLPPLPPKLQPPAAPVLPQEGHAGVSLQQKRLEEDLQRNLETLPSFSSDEEESVGRNQALQNSITSALSALDEPGDRRQKTDTRLSSSLLKPDQTPSMPQPVAKAEVRQKDSPREPSATASSGREGPPPGLLAARLSRVAVEGQTDEDLSDSGGEGMYRERDEFVVRNEDIESLEVTLTAGREPPAIWKVQKALLQKFVPELRDGRRVFSATNSYLGYFGDAKTMYRRVYVKFLDTVNKRESVRVCNRKPRCKPMHSMRGAQVKTLLGLKPAPPSLTSDPAAPRPPARPRPRQPRPRAEAPPKKRRRWKEELSPTDSSSSEPAEETDPQVSPGSRVLNTRTMKDTFSSFLELLVSVAMDADVLSALERENDDLLLPQMRRVDSLISDSRKRLLPKLHMGELFKTALDSFPEISVVTELNKDGEGPAFKVHLGGKAYNCKTMKPSKPPSTLPLEYTVDQKNTQWLSLYHSLQHFKYHTYLTCKDEIASLRARAGALGQDQAVQLCMQNAAWVEVLFNRFGELLNQVQLACR
ncbi:glutamine and serine-rich protein 1 [Osmerus mordax]|uniref:glutamine and serine-rich protein 1 n=1 Tax=Osmerus mordax TaxID=8014 RepID=UPI00351033F0